jgi:hypothetical protein
VNSSINFKPSLINSAFVGEWLVLDFRMHGATIKISILFFITELNRFCASCKLNIIQIKG